ncbi:hypothetical protein H5410_009865 [Solanum commersonii]|uniref:Uncharacterized protein n=1 Tax=Solanum commersonii TaxID=4109 RepID=A0A9J6AKV9_SOLCO|nr:hypothetical protein H5410_009865 [Solanum commersonii]
MEDFHQSQAYTRQCLAKLLTLFLAGRKLGLGQGIEAPGGPFQLAFGGPLRNKGTPNSSPVDAESILEVLYFC